MQAAPKTPWRGILAGDGAQLIRAVVHTAAVPVRPPGELEGAVRPISTHRGAVVDWTLAPRGGKPLSTAQVTAYQGWRSTYLVERFVGERSFVRSFLTWAESRTDVSALQSLRRGSAHVDYPAPNTIRWQAARALDACDATADQGIGLYTSVDSHAPARCILATEENVDILGDDHIMVRADGSVLSLRTGRGDRTGRFLTGWELHDSTAVIESKDQRIDVDEQVARVLRRVGREARSILVRSVALRTLAAPMLVFLRDMAEIASQNRTGMYFRSQ